MAPIAPFAPKCPKCLASVPEEAETCPCCGFEFAQLSRRVAKPSAGPRGVKAARPPSSVRTVRSNAGSGQIAPPREFSDFPDLLVPDLSEEIPFRWSAPKPRPRPHFAWKGLWAFLGAALILTALSAVGISLWAPPAGPKLSLVSVPPSGAPLWRGLFSRTQARTGPAADITAAAPAARNRSWETSSASAGAAAAPSVASAASVPSVPPVPPAASVPPGPLSLDAAANAVVFQLRAMKIFPAAN